MAGKRRFIANMALVADHAAKADLTPSCYVECGTWRGGMSFGLMALRTGIKEFHFFDSFEGLPPATDKDGERAVADQQAGRLWHNNNSAAIDDFTTHLERFRRPDQITTVTKGWFEDTLPDFRSDRPIGVLRMDGDWYESTLCILRQLFDKVMPGGLIIIDDYYDWRGCACAVHEFLVRSGGPERIRQTPDGEVAYLVKGRAE